MLQSRSLAITQNNKTPAYETSVLAELHAHRTMPVIFHAHG